METKSDRQPDCSPDVLPALCELAEADIPEELEAKLEATA